VGTAQREAPNVEKVRQLHVSEVNTQSKHDPISLESTLAFQKVSHLIPADVPIILESRVEESEINEEIQAALAALTPASELAIASD
jgi:DNA-directed RNA polymerase sigma subunit (sigma70/sigma32)